MASPASPQVASCPTREKLLADYRRRLAENNNAFSRMLDSHTVAEAAHLTKDLFKACVGAREALQRHEQSHGCKPA